MHQYANGPWEKKPISIALYLDKVWGNWKLLIAARKIHSLFCTPSSVPQEMDPQPQQVIWNPDGGYSSRLAHVQMWHELYLANQPSRPLHGHTSAVSLHTTPTLCFQRVGEWQVCGNCIHSSPKRQHQLQGLSTQRAPKPGEESSPTNAAH